MLKTATEEQRQQSLKIIKLVMGFFIAAYFVTDMIFLFFTTELFNVFHFFYGIIGLKSEPYPEHTFYMALTHGNMWMLTFMSYWTWKDPIGNRVMFPVICVSKSAAVITGIGYFIFVNGYWSNLVIPLTDLSQVFSSLIFYKAAKEIAAAQGQI